LVLALAVGACQSNLATTALPLEVARTELAALMLDVTTADAHRYRVLDDHGRWFGPSDIVWVAQAQTFAAVYFTHSDLDGQFHLQLATSSDLFNWTWRVELADRASQPSIAAGPDGRYLVAWEQEPDPIHMVLEEFASWDDLLADRPARHFDVPITTPACGEGTPSFESVSSERVQIGFHYHGGCERDRQAVGWTDWTTWESELRPELDQALIENGIEGHMGDRDSITYGGHEFMIIEGQRVLDDWSSWRLFLYDAETQSALPLEIKTHAGSVSVANSSVALVQIEGREAILVTLGIFTEGSLGGEDGGLVYYRFI
jgi:hypothetical protein